MNSEDGKTGRREEEKALIAITHHETHETNELTPLAATGTICSLFPSPRNCSTPTFRSKTGRRRDWMIR